MRIIKKSGEAVPLSVSGQSSEKAGTDAAKSPYRKGGKRVNSSKSTNSQGGQHDRLNQNSTTTKQGGETSDFSLVLGKGIRLLSMREHSVKEIRNKLSAKCDSLDLVEAVIDELLENNYLSNDRFTESYVRSRGNRGVGPVKIRAELLSKGVEDQLIDQYLKPGASIWFDNAAAQYKKKFDTSEVIDYAAWTKRARFLQGRGFNMDHIHSTVPPIDSD
ncbi:MAG: regulatory protein RecX [Pseudomonadota bacterium]